jgi:hypothetical protein
VTFSVAPGVSGGSVLGVGVPEPSPPPALLPGAGVPEPPLGGWFCGAGRVGGFPGAEPIRPVELGPVAPVAAAPGAAGGGVAGVGDAPGAAAVCGVCLLVTGGATTIFASGGEANREPGATEGTRTVPESSRTAIAAAPMMSATAAAAPARATARAWLPLRLWSADTGPTPFPDNPSSALDREIPESLTQINPQRGWTCAVYG